MINQRALAEQAELTGERRVRVQPEVLRVYEKCSFVPEGVPRDALRWDGE